MARFQRGGETLELWLVRGEPWAERLEDASEIWSRRDDGEPQLRWRSTPPPDDAYRDMQRTLILGGWMRVHDPAREVAHAPVPHHAELDARLRESVDADVVAVWADWLGEHGTPLAAWLAADRGPTRPRRDQIAEAARVRHDALAPLDDRLGDAARLRPGAPQLEARLAHGLIVSAAIGGQLERDDATQLVWELLRHPLARYLQELAIRGDAACDLRLLVDLVMTAEPAPPLRSLVLGDWTLRREPSAIGELGAIGTRFPALAELAITGDDVGLDGLAIPSARSFALHVPRMSPQQLAAIVRAPWPRLTTLALEVGSRSTVTAGELAMLLGGAVALPALRSVTLDEVAFGTELAGFVTGSPVVRALDRFELRDCRISPDAAAALRAAGVNLVVR
nr:hypothetical protein [Kofleriaceae bacterium]